MYDLNLISIHTNQGTPLDRVIGFQAAAPPRRAARSRAEDLLVLSLNLKGQENITDETQEAWLSRLVQDFYKTSGSVTSALRMLIETLNLMMMEANLKLAKEGKSIAGAVNVIALHRRSLYIAQSGQAHAYTLTHQGLQHFTDTSQSDRGLAFSRTPAIRYYQADLGTGGYLFMAEKPSESWTEDLLLSDGFPGLERLRRRLMHQVSPTFRLDLVQIVPGEGEIHISQPASSPGKSTKDDQQGVPPAMPAPARPLQPITEEAVGETEIGETQEVQLAADALKEADSTQGDQAGFDETMAEEALDVQKLDDHAPLTTEQPIPAPHIHTGSPATLINASLHQEEDKRRRDRERMNQRGAELKQTGLKGLAAFFDWQHQARSKIQSFFKEFQARLSPSTEANAATLSKGTLLIIAVIVPLVVVAIAVGVYLIRGRSLQHQYYYEQASAASQTAMAAEDTDTARVELAQALTYLAQAEEYKSSEDALALRETVQAALDNLDGAVRLRYQPAITEELYSEIKITRIVSYGLDLYLFDAQGGRVIHAIGGQRGYDLDPDFVCGPGNYSGGGVDALVDMAALPINNPYQAHILAVDGRGNIVYCSPGQNPVVQSLPSSEGENFSKIAFGNSSLYILDPPNNAVRVYPSTNGQFLETPVNFFSAAQNGEFLDITNVIDLAINGPDLFLLRGNGKLINCVYTGLPGNPVNCENPVEYIDGRPGKEDQGMEMPEGDYVAVLYNSPPDPSVSILDSSTADIYRFSLRFRLHQRLRPDMSDFTIDIPGATAFTIGIDQVAFIAFGNQVFYAYIE